MDITLMTHIHIVTLTQLTNKVIIIMNVGNWSPSQAQQGGQQNTVNQAEIY